MRFAAKQAFGIRDTSIRRLKFMRGFFIVLIGIVLYRSFFYQVLTRESWMALLKSQYQRRVKLYARRGVIYDRDMKLLAMDIPVNSIAMDPSLVNDISGVSARLTEILGREKEEFARLLEENRDRSFVRMTIEITEEQRLELQKAEIPGVILIRERKRVRPFGDLAFPVIGLSDRQHRGVGGIEQSMDDVLKGGDGWAIYQKDALNRNFLSLDYPVEPPRNGYHVIVTLDHAFQAIVEEELCSGVERHQARYGTAVLMDPFTGEILAMSSVTAEALDAHGANLVELLNNRAVQATFEPGSTFKIVTAAAALESGLYTPGSLIHCENGLFEIGNHAVHDHDRAFDWLTLSQVMEYSSNIGIAKVGRSLGRNRLFSIAQNFGFGNRTGIELPGESQGILRPVYRWSDISTTSISFGQEISVTTLQMACVISVIANGGDLVKPRILLSIMDESGNTIKDTSPVIIRKVISKQTAESLSEILMGVVENGSGKAAAVEGVRVAGKTGTAQKSVPGYDGYYPGAHVSSFAGFWPAEAPMYAMIVMLDEPQKNYGGAKSAAPIFGRIVERIMGIPSRSPRLDQGQPDGTRLVFSKLTSTETEAKEQKEERKMHLDSPYHVPDVKGLSVREALQVLAQRRLKARIVGNGVIRQQTPPPGTRIEEGMICRLNCEDWVPEGIDR